MKDIFISEEDQHQNKDINPLNIVPKRYAISTNILCTIKDKGIEKFLLINSDPEISKTWYPFYITINAFYPFAAQKYGALIQEYNKEIIVNAEKNRIEKAMAEFSSMFDCGKVKVQNMHRNEYWLKYSKSSNVWTIYLFEFYIANQVEDIAALKAKINDKNVLLPIGDARSLSNILSHGTFESLPIVSNAIKLLSENDSLSVLIDKAL